LLVMKLLLCLFFCLPVRAADDDSIYDPQEGPPATGWGSALKYFKKGGENSTSTSVNPSSGAGKNRMFSLNNAVFVNNKANQALDTPGQWGLNLGVEWDDVVIGQGFYINYDDYKQASKFSMAYGLFYPRIETHFPLYIKANLGLGYFKGDFNSDTLAFDYNFFSGVQFFTRHNVLFNIEVGSKNYTRIFTRSQLNSFVLSSGLAVVF
jgi:hypothetical protein